MTKQEQIKILVDAANRGIAARQMLVEWYAADAEIILDSGEAIPLTSNEIDWAKKFRSKRGSRVKTRSNKKK